MRSSFDPPGLSRAGKSVAVWKSGARKRKSFNIGADGSSRRVSKPTDRIQITKHNKVIGNDACRRARFGRRSRFRVGLLQKPLVRADRHHPVPDRCHFRISFGHFGRAADLLLWLGCGNFDECAAARFTMLCPPQVVRAGCAVRCALDKAEKWFAMLTDTVAAPNVRFVVIDLVVERMIDGDICAGHLIYTFHEALEVRTVATVRLANVQHKQIGMDHFMLESTDLAKRE